MRTVQYTMLHSIVITVYIMLHSIVIVHIASTAQYSDSAYDAKYSDSVYMLHSIVIVCTCCTVS